MKITLIEINSLNPAEYNPRQISNKQYEDLKASMEKFGCVDPIIININPERSNVVVGGHQRLRILRELGAEKVPTVSVNLSEEDERELNVRLNKSGGEWDMDILANEFDVVDLKEWGFKDIELGFNIDKIVEGNTEDDHIPEVKESRVKLGEVWQLGKHRLMCGDSTKESDVKKLMNGQKADLLLTDPPYGINYGNQLIKGEKFKDKTNNHGWRNFGNPEWDEKKPEAHIFVRLINMTDNQIIWGGNYFTDILKPSMGWLIWDKGQRGFSLADGEMAWTSFNNALRIKEYSRAKANKENKKHPTQKPVDIINWCIEYADRHSKKKPKYILDTYLGSGTTLIACEKTNRVCYGLEFDTKYCDVIIERWEQFTGQKATKL